MKLKENLIKITNYCFLSLDQAYDLIITKIFKYRLFRDLLVYLILTSILFVLAAIPFLVFVVYLWFFGFPIVYLLIFLIRIFKGKFVLHLFFNFVFIFAVSLYFFAITTFSTRGDLSFGYLYAISILLISLGYSIYWLINFYYIFRFLKKKYLNKSDTKNVSR